jgi:hypothetical protein
MRSVIYQSETIDNAEHEFGESMEPRIPAVMITNDGYEVAMLFTRSQIVAATERADNEPVEANEILTRYARSRARLIAMVVGSIAFSGVAGFLAGTLGVVP